MTLAVLTIWLLAFELWSRWVTRTPLDEPIRLVGGTTVVKDIRVPIRERYSLVLVFQRENIAFEELRRLIGEAWYKDGKPIPSGVPVIVRWSFTPHGAASPTVSGTKESFGSTGWSALDVERNVDRVQFEPGRYRFEAQILRDAPELSHMHTRIALRLHAKSTSAWEIAFAFFGAIANFLVIIPLAIVLAVVLAYRGIKYRLRLTSNPSSSGRDISASGADSRRST